MVKKPKKEILIKGDYIMATPTIGTATSTPATYPKLHDRIVPNYSPEINGLNRRLVAFNDDLSSHKLELVECSTGDTCEDGHEYTYRPDYNETFGSLKHRYSLPNGYLRANGAAAKLGGNPGDVKIIPHKHPPLKDNYILRFKPSELETFVGLR